MKVLLLNGSGKEKGCTYTALDIVAKTLNEEGIETEIVFIGNKPFRDCTSCMHCKKELMNRCVFPDDGVNDFIEKAKNADGFVFGTPVYYAHASGRILSFLDRAFYAGGSVFRHKVGAGVASARRAGTIPSIDELNKYFTISEMPVVSSTYWNNVHGTVPEDVLKDKEGVQTMENLGKNMAWLLKCIHAGKENGIACPDTKKIERTNYIR